ncbi:MAG: signal recognition particle-docking protein FtsY [Myxococcales bacterium]|nr:signal recognition particle-docking protein FtsY [Myxococcales bacterium]
MPVTGEELVTLLIALAATALVVLGIRRASMRSTLGDGKVKGRPELRGDDSESSAKSEESTQKAGELATGDDERDDAASGEDEEARRLGVGLAKTRSTGFVSRLGKLFARKKIDDSLLEELEEVLFTADIGPKTANRLLDSIKSELSKSELDDPSEVWKMLQDESVRILDVKAPDIDFGSQSPFVLLVLGVNGAGKTTTIGKLAAKLQAEGKKVLLAAGDTFRAAAVEQLQVWGERAGAHVVRGKDGQDPSSVIFDAIKRGQAESYDVVICDTAGRLHTKVELMEELKKVGRVCEKAMPGCPHETWLVLDSTTGQNAIQQAIHFKAAMEVTGIVLTKLDGTAKGGVVLGISEEMGVPIRYIGIGEQVDDLRAFAPASFVSALYQDGSQSGSEDPAL